MQRRPEQQLCALEQICPEAEQVAPGWHEPLAWPAGIEQLKPGQHSAVPEQIPPWLTQVCGATHVPAAQLPEQHSAPEAQASPSLRQLPQAPAMQAPEQQASALEQLAPFSRQGSPASRTTPASAPSWVVEVRQTRPPSSPEERQERPLQQAPAPVAPGTHGLPAAAHCGDWQT